MAFFTEHFWVTASEMRCTLRKSKKAGKDIRQSTVLFVVLIVFFEKVETFFKQTAKASKSVYSFHL